MASRVFFLKDSWARALEDPNARADPGVVWPHIRALNAPELAGAARKSDFVCAYREKNYGIMWHSTAMLFQYQIGKYVKAHDQHTNATELMGFQAHPDQRPLGKWAEHLRLPVLARLWPVCYGGGFITSRDAVQSNGRLLWARIARNLDRGVDSIEEGHFMERTCTWAALLAPRVSPGDMDTALCGAQRGCTYPHHKGPSFTGALIDCACEDVQKCKNNPGHDGGPMSTLTTCFLAYCNAHNDLRKYLCGGAECTSTRQGRACMQHWLKTGIREVQSKRYRTAPPCDQR